MIGNEEENFNSKPEGTKGDAKKHGTNGVPSGSSSFTSSYPTGAPDRARAGAMEVTVENNIEKAMKILKRKLIKEGLFKELKARRYYEKPSIKKKRKVKESLKKARKEEARNRKNQGLFS